MRTFRNLCVVSIFTFAVLLLFGHSEQALAKKKTCVWEGRAPACNGKCQAGYTPVGRSKTGEGKKCVTGTKVECCKTADVRIRGTAPACNGKCKSGETRVGDSDKGLNGQPCLAGKAAICLIKIK